MKKSKYFYLDIKIIDSWMDYYSHKMYIIFEIANCWKLMERELEVRSKKDEEI